MAEKKKIKDEDIKEAVETKETVEAKEETDVGVPDTQLANVTKKEFVNELYRRGYSPENIMNKQLKKGSELEAAAIHGFSKGGSLPKQMELFSEGGLKQEGGSVDPVSGNDVPVGSTKKEVRDDIPAQLSEGEFVMPADVVRFHGLDKMMELRDEAKAGLRKMEAMGQMGNADEATLPDDVPFGMDDLDIDDEPTEMAEGGVVQAANGTFMSPNTGIGGFQQSQFANYTPQFTSYVPTQLPTTSYIAPQQQTTPLASQQTLPKFEDVIPAPEGKYDEIIEYENEEGLKLSIPFINGKPIFPIPKGYKKVDKGLVKPDPKPETIVPSVQTQQREDDGGDDPRPTVVETATLGNTKYNIGYTSSDPIGLPGILGGIATAVSGRNDQVTLTNPSTKEKATISKQTFDSLKGQSGSQVNSFLGNVFNAQKAVDFNKDRIAQNFPVRSAVKDVGAAFGIGQSFGTPIDQQTAAAKEIAKDMNIDYNGQSLAEMIAMSIADKDKTSTSVGRASVDTSRLGRVDSFQEIQDKADRRDRDQQADIAGTGLGRRTSTRDPSRGLSPGALGGRDVYGYGSMTQSTDDEAADIAGAGGGRPQATMSPQEAQQKGIEMGFESHTVAPGTATNEAIAQAENQGDKAAPAGSQYSANGKFSSPEPEQSSDPGGGKSIVCTEMYRQTQLEDWSQAMKTWYVYQKKYLTNTHQIGYHYLFKPFVSGMKVNNTLTNIGAYFAKKRTQHLKHILTKGKAKDSLVGNIFCKIIHPVVYMIGLLISK